MNHNKLYKLFIFFFPLCILLSSCGEEEEPKLGDSQIVGTWEWTFPIAGTNESAIFRFVFNSDKKGTFYSRTFETNYNFATQTYIIEEIFDETIPIEWEHNENMIYVKQIGIYDPEDRMEIELEYIPSKNILRLHKDSSGEILDALEFNKIKS